MRRQLATLLVLVCVALVHAQSQTTLPLKRVTSSCTIFIFAPAKLFRNCACTT
jgi:hypothetical protein